MKNSYKTWVVFRRILFCLFILFLLNYYSVQSGYYESELAKKTILTEEKKKEFEEDVKNNEFVDIKDYLETPYVDTSSPISDLGYNSSQIINDFITDKAIKLFSFLGKFFS